MTGVRADFDAVEDQSMKSVSALMVNGLLASDITPDGLFTDISNMDSDGNRAVWRHITTTGIQQLLTRNAGGNYPEGTFLRGYETSAYDPDLQDAIQIVVPEERSDKEQKMYQAALDRAQKELNEIHRKNIADPLDVFNLAFTAPTAYPNAHFVAKGNQGLDGNFTALNERLVSTIHARADAGTTISNAVNTSGNAAVFSDTNYYAGLEQAQAVVDDVGKPMPMMSGTKTIVIPPASGLVRTAKELNISEWKVATTNNDENINKGTFSTIVSSPYLLSSYNAPTVSNKTEWFVVDTSTREREVGTGLVRVSFVPTDSRVERLMPNDAIVFKVKQSYSYVWTDFRNIMGSNGSNTTYNV